MGIRKSGDATVSANRTLGMSRRTQQTDILEGVTSRCSESTGKQGQNGIQTLPKRWQKRPQEQPDEGLHSLARRTTRRAPTGGFTPQRGGAESRSPVRSVIPRAVAIKTECIWNMKGAAGLSCDTARPVGVRQSDGQHRRDGLGVEQQGGDAGFALRLGLVGRLLHMRADSIARQPLGRSFGYASATPTPRSDSGSLEGTG